MYDSTPPPPGQRSSNPPYPHVLLPHLRLRVKWYTPVATEKDAFLPITNFFVYVYFWMTVKQKDQNLS